MDKNFTDKNFNDIVEHYAMKIGKSFTQALWDICDELGMKFHIKLSTSEKKEILKHILPHIENSLPLDLLIKARQWIESGRRGQKKKDEEG